MTELVGFLDESRKPIRDPVTRKPVPDAGHYVVAAAVVLDGTLDETRAAIAKIEQGLGYRLHYSELRTRKRRLEAVEAVAALDHWDGYLFETARPLPASISEHHARAKVLTKALLHLSNDTGILRVNLETRARPARGFRTLDEKDNQVLQRLLTTKQVPADLRIAHVTKAEEVLSIADLLAGARTDFLCAADREPYAMLAHRVQAIGRAFKDA